MIHDTLVSFWTPVEARQMPKHSRKQDRLQLMPMAVKPATDTQMNLKKAVVKELIDLDYMREGGGGGEKPSDMIDST